MPLFLLGRMTRLLALMLLLIAVLGGVLLLLFTGYELTVTDKRIYGRIRGKRVDLPVDSISAIASTNFGQGITVATSSGKISFHLLKNADAIYEVLNNLLIERQQAKQTAAAPTVVQQSDSADQLKKYKDLLDSGVITQEEFDAKKAQLLGL
ncbi:MAG: SHOCT domain-containing protein [Clostridia bacterium]|nr:SHOCT domain-containing protein [Clostridia bacterium]